MRSTRQQPVSSGVDAEEWAELTERGRADGTVHAEEVALVLRNVELTGDVLEATREALSEEGISIDEAVERRRRRRAAPSPGRSRSSSSPTTRPTSGCSAGAAAAGRAG